MQKIYKNVTDLDRRCYEEYGLSEDILMEHAAFEIALFIKSRFDRSKTVLIVAGCGNNGADGIALSRILHNDYQVKIVLPLGVKSDMAKLQLDRAKKIGVEVVESIFESDIVVDALFGSGFSGDMKQNISSLLEEINTLVGYKIACDIPSGIKENGNISTATFRANTTITMGSLKLSLFSDDAKDFVGDIHVANLGVSREKYESRSDFFLLEKDDFKPPHRDKRNSHKGDFGHLVVVGGQKISAAILSSLGAFRFGVALVTILTSKRENIPFEILQDSSIPKNIKAMAIGMGLGSREIDGEILESAFKTPLVIDADMFYKDEILKILERNEKVVLTPHPKEFASLLKITGIGEYSVDQIQRDRFELSLKFSLKYKNVVLLLKGANMIVAQNQNLYINDMGTNRLSKGGSGDVLSGFIASLLAQGYQPLQAALQGSIALSASAKNITKNSYALSPMDLIDSISTI